MKLWSALVAALILAVPFGARAAEPSPFFDAFANICLKSTSAVQASADLARKAGFGDVAIPKAQQFEEMAALAKPGAGGLTLVFGSMPLPARNGYPAQWGLSCMVVGEQSADMAAIQRWVGFQPYDDEAGQALYAFELVDGRPVEMNGDDPAAVTAALNRKGYFLLMLGRPSDGRALVVTTYGRLLAKP